MVNGPERYLCAPTRFIEHGHGLALRPLNDELRFREELPDFPWGGSRQVKKRTAAGQRILRKRHGNAMVV